MTKEQLLKVLAQAKDRASIDPEAAHIEADCALIEYIGDTDIRRAFFAIKKHYN